MSEKSIKLRCDINWRRLICNVLIPAAIMAGAIVALNWLGWLLDWQRFLKGISISAFGGAFFLYFVMGWLRGLFPNKLVIYEGRQIYEFKFAPPKCLTVWTGILERFLFTISILVGAPALIGIWFGLKVATVWKIWDKVERRIETAYIFIIGNALSILFGFIGAWIAIGKFPYPLPKEVIINFWFDVKSVAIHATHLI